MKTSTILSAAIFCIRALSTPRPGALEPGPARASQGNVENISKDQKEIELARRSAHQEKSNDNVYEDLMQGLELNGKWWAPHEEMNVLNQLLHVYSELPMAFWIRLLFHLQSEKNRNGLITPKYVIYTEELYKLTRNWVLAELKPFSDMLTDVSWEHADQQQILMEILDSDYLWPCVIMAYSMRYDKGSEMEAMSSLYHETFWGLNNKLDSYWLRLLTVAGLSQEAELIGFSLYPIITDLPFASIFSYRDLYAMYNEAFALYSDMDLDQVGLKTFLVQLKRRVVAEGYYVFSSERALDDNTNDQTSMDKADSEGSTFIISREHEYSERQKLANKKERIYQHREVSDRQLRQIACVLLYTTLIKAGLPGVAQKLEIGLSETEVQSFYQTFDSVIGSIPLDYDERDDLMTKTFDGSVDVVESALLDVIKATSNGAQQVIDERNKPYSTKILLPHSLTMTSIRYKQLVSIHSIQIGPERETYWGRGDVE